MYGNALQLRKWTINHAIDDLKLGMVKNVHIDET